jgi:hypothetical protein
MKRRTVARLIAAVLLAYGSGLLLVAFDKQELQSYRGLSREALLAKLTSIHDSNFDASFLGSLFIIGCVVLCMDALTGLVELIINRISPSPPTSSSSIEAIAPDNGSRVG